MNSLRASTWLVALLLHGAVLMLLLVHKVSSGTSLDTGSGYDILKTEQGMRIEAIFLPGNDRETSAAVEEIAANEPPAEEAKPVKPDEIEAIASTASETVEAKPVEVTEPKPPAPQPVQARVQPQQVAEFKQQNLSAAQTGGDATQMHRYQGILFKAFQRKKVDPQTRRRGTVMIRFTLDISGQVLSREIAASSGSQALDEAAVNSFDRAVPLPPIPATVSREPMTLVVPFEYLTQ
jgi:periplasmic protein TonB